MTVRKARPAARLLMIDPDGNILLFCFDAGKGSPFWATPGGACDPGEPYEEAARREMMEETGWSLDPGPEVAQRLVEFTTLEGEEVWADERYFLVRVPNQMLSTDGHTELERRVMQSHRWWSLAELKVTEDVIFPADILEMLNVSVTNTPI
jgi:8-oxo-dGTP diphosphatase